MCVPYKMGTKVSTCLCVQIYRIAMALSRTLTEFSKCLLNNYYSFEINITNYKLVNSHGAKKFTFTELRILA